MKKSFLIVGLSLLLSTTTVLADEYDDCMKSVKDGSEEIPCMQKETKRLMPLIIKEYQAISQDDAFKKWNGKQGMIKGSNLMAQYDAWLEYRNSYCSLYTLSKSKLGNGNVYNSAKCLYDITSRHYNYISEIINNYNTEVYGG